MKLGGWLGGQLAVVCDLLAQWAYVSWPVQDAQMWPYIWHLLQCRSSRRSLVMVTTWPET